MLRLNQHRTSESEECGRNERKDETGTTNVLKRNPDGCIHSFSSGTGKLVKLHEVMNALLLIVRDVRCESGSEYDQTSKMAFIDENAKITEY